MIGRRHILTVLTVGVLAACSPSAPTPSAALVEPTASPSAEPSPSDSPSPAPSPTPTAAPTPTAELTASPAPTPAPTPVPWKSYTSKRYHYKMKYPPTWVVTPGSSRIADEYDGFALPYVYVYRDTVSGVASVSLTVTHDIAYFKSHYKAKLQSNKPIKLDGWSGRILTFKGTQSGLPMLFQHILVAKGRVGYTLDLEGNYADAAADKALFKTMYKTWRVT